MSKKMAAGVIIGILAISGFMGLYFLPQLTQTNGTNPALAAIFLTPQVPSQKWALIVCSDSSFPNETTPSGWYDEGDFGGGSGDFLFTQIIAQSIGGWDQIHGCNIPTHSGPPCLNITNSVAASGHWTTYNFRNPGTQGKVFAILDPNNYITLNVCISTTNANGPKTVWETMIPGFVNPAPGYGAFFGIIWLNGTTVIPSTQAIGATWSRNYNGTTLWTNDTLMALPIKDAPSGAVGFAIALVLDGAGDAYFDDVDLSIIPFPQVGGGIPGYDGFPAQALQAYNACKSHGFDDNHIMMMIDSGDQKVDINLFDSIANDYTYYKNLYNGCYDYEGTNVTKANFVKEMNVSVSSSWASKIGKKDNVLIYMIDHGTKISVDAVFCFPRSSDNLTKVEMKNLLDKINCSKLALLVDCCFSNLFIDNLDASNRIQIAAATNVPSWYWKMATPNHWAGSWYFHPFWEALNSSNTIAQANNTACNYVPWSQAKNISIIQGPQIRDSSGLLSSWNPLL